MIRLCTCIGRSSSSLQNPNNPDDSNICKSCGGKLAVDGKGALSGNMLNTMGLELPRPIDPEVKWKTASRGRQRAVRRARTSFIGEDRMKSAIRTLNAGDNAADQESNKAGEIPVSESEKLGVSILGRRFSDPIESVPIKKRRLLMARSPSPPPSSSQLDQSEQILSNSCGDSSSYGKHRKGRTLAGEDFCSRDAKKGLLDAADFSGISILAAAALESGMEGDILNGECSIPNVQSLKERKLEDIMRSTESSSLPDIKEKSKSFDDSHCESDRPLEASASAPDAKSSVVTTLNSSDSPDDSASAPDAKTSVVTTLNSSVNPDKSVGCSQTTVENTKRGDCSRDSRLHWDLNVAMEVWDSNCDGGMVGSEPSAAAVSESNGNENEMKELGTCQNPVVSTDTGDIPDLSDDKIHAVDMLKDAKMKEESDIPGDSSSLPSCSGSAQIVQQLESASLNLKDSYAETKDFPNQQKTSYASEVESHLGSNLVCSTLAPITEHAALTADVEKVEVSHSLLLEHEGSSHLVAAEGFGGGNAIQACELGSRVDRSISKPVSEESTNLATICVFNKSFAVHGLNDTQLGQAARQSISEFEKQELLDVDSGSGKVDLSINKKAEYGSDGFCVTEKAPDANTDGNLSDPHPENSQKSANLDEVTCMNAKGATADLLIDDKNCSRKDDANTSNAKADCITNAVSQATAPSSEGTEPPIIEPDDVVGSQAEAKSYLNGYENKLGKVASHDFLDCCDDSDASHIGTDQVAGMEKVDLEDDDSQYEDGELRESGHHYWADDGYEEMEHVDYEGSDYKENEVASDIPSASLTIESMSHKNAGFSVAGNDGIQSRKKDSDAAVLPALLNCSSSTNYLDTGSGKRCAESAGEKTRSAHLRVKDETQTYELDASLLTASTATDSRFQRGANGLGEHPSSMRTKSTGWDMLPENARTSRHGSRDGVDSANQSVATTSLDAARGSDSLRQMRLSLNRDMQSRIERPRSFDGPHRNDPCRSDDGYRLGSKSERTIGTHKSLGRGGTSRHSQVSGRGEQWVETPNHSGSTRPRSPDYYGYSPPGPMNAAEAAVAKMESNGFVVAPDGTLVKAVGAATAGRVPRRTGNTSLNSSHRPLSGRGSPIDRDGGMSRGPARAREASPDRHFGVNRNRSGRYDLEIEKDRFHRVVPDGSMNSVHHSLSRRQRSFSPHRASLHISRSHTRSPSRSRSRSPHLWTSPRGRRDIGANGGSTLRRHSRSPPNYRTEVRMERMTSPHRRPAFQDRIIRYSPSSRNHTYAPHTSRWVDERKCSPVDLRDHNYKRYSRRSPPPLRISSRSDRFDLMDSPGRSRPEEFYRPMHSNRFPAYGFERGNRHDGNGDDRREFADGCGTLHSVRPYDRNGSMKRFRNDAGDGFRSHNSAPKSPEFQRRGSPRNFERGFERQLADSPRGAKEEKDPFNYARNGKDNAAYKPYEIQDRDDDIAVRRRPS